jgi:hypothetical protein
VSWRVIRAAVAGTSHVRDQLPCQDSCVTASYPLPGGGEALIVAVADGAGSAQFGGRGAQLACEIARDHMVSRLAAAEWRPPLQPQVAEWFASVRDALEATALAEALPLRELATTLLLLLVLPQAAAYGHIGDGGIAVDHGAGLELAFWPQVGEYANMTRFITDADALEHVRVVVTESVPDELALFTDGIQRLALDFKSCAVHAPFFAPMMAVLRGQPPAQCAVLEAQLAVFLDSAKVNSRTDDDKTLVLASRRLEPATHSG